MTLPISLTGARAIFSIATLPRGRAPLAVCLSVFLLGFAALEIRAQEEPTRLDELVVSDGRVQFFFFSAGQCIQISNTTINGVTYTIHSSYWQRRSGGGSPWEEVPGTQETGRMCSLSPDSAGEYRLVADITIGDERGLYSSNILTKTGTDPEPEAGLAPADQAAFDSLAVGKQIVNPVSDDRLVFLSPGRIREFDQGESFDGDYQYVNTGEDTGTLTYTYDVTGNNPNVEKSVVELTFTSMTAGTFVYTYTESGSPPETLRGSFELVDAAVEPDTVPRVPVLDAAFSLDGAVQVRWLLVPGATSYDVRWKSGNQEYSDTLDDRLVNIPAPPSPETELNFELGDLMNGTEYALQARAKNSAGDSDWSEEARVTPAGTTPPAVEPKPPGEVQATVEAAVEAGGGLRAGGPPVTIDMSTLFSFGAGVTADTDYAAQSSDPALVTAETTDERLVLTPGNAPPAGASSSLAVGAADGDPARVTITVTAVRAGEMAEVEVHGRGRGGGGAGAGAPAARATAPGAGSGGRRGEAARAVRAAPVGSPTRRDVGVAHAGIRPVCRVCGRVRVG